MALKSWWRSWIGDSQKPPEKDEHTMVSDSLMMELDYHIKELERYYWEKEQEQRRQQTGVDYSWLITSMPKSYEISQLDRLELEEQCYKVKPTECGKIITLFREATLREPPIQDMAKIMKAIIVQTLEQRPKEETLSQWVTRRTANLTSLKLRPSPRVSPVSLENDVENQQLAERNYMQRRSIDDSFQRVTSPV